MVQSYFRSPSGRTIHKSGIEPDVLFEAGSDESALMSEALTLLKTDRTTEGLHARL